MQIIPHFFFFVFPLPQPASPIFKEDPIASKRRPFVFRRVKEVLRVLGVLKVSLFTIA
jgi:hypothetical protein